MAEEQELRIIATLDDQASAGLARLQGNVRQLGSGPQAQAMEGIRRQSGEAAEGLKSLSSGFGSVMTSITGFAGMAALVPVALAGMAASFVSSGIGEFADKLNRLGREANQTGQSLAQYRANISTLMSAGISEQEAAAVIQRFVDVQADLSQRGSRIRQQILASTPLEGRDEMQNWLSNVMVAPAEQAMAMVQQRGEQIRRGAAEQARSQAAEQGRSLDEQHAYAERAGAEAQRRFLGMFGAEALAHVRTPFREATQEEIALQRQRLDATQRWGDATSELRSGWNDLKETVASIAIGPLTNEVRDLVALVRLAADGARAIERWMRGPPPQATEEMQKMTEQADLMGVAVSAVRGFFAQAAGEDGQTFVDRLREIKQSADTLVPDHIKDFFDNPGEGIANGLRRAKEWADTLVPDHIKDFFDNPGEGILALIIRARDAAASLIPQVVKDFFENPSESLLGMIDRMTTAAANLIPQSVQDFFADPSDALLRLMDQLREKFLNLLPAWMQRLLGGGDATATTPVAETPPISVVATPAPAAETVPAAPAATETPSFAERLANMMPAWMRRQEPPSGEAQPAAPPANFMQRIDAAEGAPILVQPQAGEMPSFAERWAGLQGGDQIGGDQAAFSGASPSWQSAAQLPEAAAQLDQSAAQQVNVSGTGRIRVDVRAPEGTRVDAQGEGLFRTTEITRQTQMLPAEFGPAAGVSAGSLGAG